MILLSQEKSWENQKLLAFFWVYPKNNLRIVLEWLIALFFCGKIVAP